MRIREISYYHEYSCLAGDCPQTCCHGWLIPLVEEDNRRFVKEGGLLGLRLFLARSGSGDGVFNRHCGSCSFLNRRGLCSLQVKKGHEFIPEVCRDYPRFYRNYKSFEERFIDLSCVQGALLFLRNNDRLFLVETEGSPESDPCCTNEDEAFLHALSESRRKMTDELLAVDSFDGLSKTLSRILSFAVETEKHYLREGSAQYDGGALKENVSFAEGAVRESHPVYRPYDKSTVPEGEQFKALFPFPLSVFKRLFEDTALYNGFLFYTNPFLYRLFRIYFDVKKKRRKDPDGLGRLYESYTGRFPAMAGKYAAYYAFYLYRYYLQSYEDYSFIKNTSLGIVHMNMILMADMLYENRNHSLSEREQAMIISAYDKKACFNDQVKSRMYEIFSEFCIPSGTFG